MTSLLASQFGRFRLLWSALMMPAFLTLISRVSSGFLRKLFFPSGTLICSLAWRPLPPIVRYHRRNPMRFSIEGRSSQA